MKHFFQTPSPEYNFWVEENVLIHNINIFVPYSNKTIKHKVKYFVRRKRSMKVKVPRALKSHNMALPLRSSALHHELLRKNRKHKWQSLSTSQPYSSGFRHSVCPTRQNWEKVSWNLALSPQAPTELNNPLEPSFKGTSPTLPVSGVPVPVDGTGPGERPLSVAWPQSPREVVEPTMRLRSQHLGKCLNQDKLQQGLTCTGPPDVALDGKGSLPRQLAGWRQFVLFHFGLFV